MKKLFILITLTFSCSVFSQSSSNISFVGSLDYPGTEGNDVWGYVDSSGTEYALVGMQNLYAQMDGPTILMATVMASIPTLVIFLLLQRHFIRGLTLGSMGTGKG